MLSRATLAGRLAAGHSRPPLPLRTSLLCSPARHHSPCARAYRKTSPLFSPSFSTHPSGRLVAAGTLFGGIFACGLLVKTVHAASSQAHDGDHDDEDEYAEEPGWFEATSNWISGQLSSVTGSSRDKKLLPEAVPAEFGGKKYTLVVSDKVLLATQYEPRAGGMLTKKRPAAEFFLASAAQWYEVVLFSDGAFAERQLILDKLDPNHYCTYKLYKDSTVFEGGKSVKDLTQLNRELKHVIALDVDADCVIPRENVLEVPQYGGEERDSTLLELLPFLELVGRRQPEDVRPAVTVCGKKGPVFFKDALAKAKQAARQAAMAQAANGPHNMTAAQQPWRNGQ